MKDIDRLKRDHAILRSKLDVLEATLRIGSEAWYVLREVCFTLSRQLRNHMKREEELIVACRSAMNPVVLAEVAVEHRDEPEHLRTINRFFVEEQGHDLDRLRPALSMVIQGLRRHMTEEEAGLFPILERVLAARTFESTVTEKASRQRVHECMTVNHVVREYPQTKTVFERLFISPLRDGCTCLDEVAWRHGIEGEELVAQLEQAISPEQLPTQALEREAISCGCR